MKPKLMIWDWNGTLLDDMNFTYEIENRMLLERGMKSIPDKDFYLNNFGFPIKDYYIKLGYDFEKYPYEELAAEFHNLYTDGYRKCSLKDGAIKVLDIIKNEGIDQTILSASQQDRLLEQVEHYGIKKFFKELLGLTDDFAHSKIERAKSYLLSQGISVRDVLFVGDTDHDYAAASSVGCKCVLITGGHQSKKILEKCGAPILDSIEELPHFIGIS